MRGDYDAVVIGSGPNGLSAAITVARAGRSVLVLEGADTIGGGTRSAELTLPGFLHDVCSAIHPLAVASPFFQELPLERYGLRWIHPDAPLAHPLEGGDAVMAERSLEATCANLGADGAAYAQLMGSAIASWQEIGGLAFTPATMALHPFAAAQFGLPALRSASALARSTFRHERARALFGGMAAHSILPLEQIPSASFGLVLTIAAHTVGWPFPEGGAQRIADALAGYLRSLGGEIITGRMVRSLEELPAARVVLCDVTPRQFLQLAGARLSGGYRYLLETYRYGPGVCKVDWALDGAIPWQASACRRAATVHVCGTLEEIEASERAPWRGELEEKPFVLLAQPTLFDGTRAPVGKHIAWAYCHVPHSSHADRSAQIETQIERFAPGFSRLILARKVTVAARMSLHNPNLIGGDVAGGASNLGQLFLRPTWRRYRTPLKHVYLCSASTPPGAGVHGLCGNWAARTALRDAFGWQEPKGER